jgi:hypothetical protein
MYYINPDKQKIKIEINAVTGLEEPSALVKFACRSQAIALHYLWCRRY